MSDSESGATESFAPGPMRDVAGKVAFITGGSSGIGLGLARAFVTAGMNVVITYRTQKHLDAAMVHLQGARARVHAINVDVTDRTGMERAAAETVAVFGKVHVLCNNAGVFAEIPLSTTTYDDWDWMMSVNVNGVFNGIHAFLPRIRAHGEGGQIVTTSSVFGLFSSRNYGSYSASKFAVVALMEALRAELVETNIGASVFCPGVVNSNVMESSRNRPRNLADTTLKADPAMLTRDREARQNPDLAMDPLEAGELVLRGIRNNDLYILTHPEFAPVIQARHEALMGYLPADLHPPSGRLTVGQAVLRRSIYDAERERQRAKEPARA